MKRFSNRRFYVCLASLSALQLAPSGDLYGVTAFGSSGTLYGATSIGSGSACGTVFQRQ